MRNFNRRPRVRRANMWRYAYIALLAAGLLWYLYMRIWQPGRIRNAQAKFDGVEAPGK